MSTFLQIKTGDVLRTRKLTATDIMHYAIAYGNIKGVFHIAENYPDTGVTLLPVDSFIQRYGADNVELIPSNVPTRNHATLRSRIKAVLGRQYDTFTFNCESLVNWVLNGRTTSKQVQTFVLATACAALAVIAILAAAASVKSVKSRLSS